MFTTTQGFTLETEGLVEIGLLPAHASLAGVIINFLRMINSVSFGQ